MASNLDETSMNMSLLDETVSHLSNQNIDSDEDLDEDEYCSETIADLFGYSDSDEEFYGYVSDVWEIVTPSSSSESPSGSDSDDENVDIAASCMSPTSLPPPKRKKKTKDKKGNDFPPCFNMKGWKKGDQNFSSKLPDFWDFFIVLKNSTFYPAN